MTTEKKITKFTDEGSSTPMNQPNSFTPTSENKGKAKQLRVIAVILWILAIAAQIVAITQLFKSPVNMTLLIILIVIDLILVAIGSILWKKSNRLDPASEKDKLKFFMQSQLGLVTAIIAFVPLVIFILTSKNIDGKQKGILGAIAGGALVVAGLVGYDFNPPSVEQYTEQANRVEWLNQGQDNVYWTKSGKVYHIYDDCSYINTSRTDEIFSGTVAKARELKNITSLCSRCEHRAMDEHKLDEKDYTPSENKTEQ